MKYLFGLLAVLFGLFCSPAMADSEHLLTKGQVQLNLLKSLESDGYLSHKLADEAKEKYVNPQDLSVPLASAATASTAHSEESLWSRYLSWANFFKVLAVVLLLVAFGGWIVRLAASLLFIIVQVPKEVYQSVFLGTWLTLTFAPQYVWASQSFYLALFGAFANLLVVSWVLTSHPRLVSILKKLFNLGVPPSSVASFWGMVYFTGLALMYQSQIFGFFAAVCLSGILSFAVYYRPGVLTMSFHKNGTPAIVFGHLAVLIAYVAMKITGHLPQETPLFAVGLEYYCTIAMGVGFLVGASPFDSLEGTGAYLLFFVLVTLAAVSGYFFFDLKVIGSILCCIAVLLALEWIGYLSFSISFLAGTFIMGLTLYGCALLLERYASMIVLRLA